MATKRNTYSNTKPGSVLNPLAQEHVPTSDKIGALVATYRVGELFAKNVLPVIGGGMPYSSGQWTVTSTGTGAAQAEATTPGGGVLLTTGSTSTFYSGLQSKQLITPAAGKVLCAYARVQVSHATQVGFNFGFGNAQADPTGTEYTDFIGFRKAPASATIKGTVVGNGGSVVQTASVLTPVAATEYVLGFYLKLGATAAKSEGAFFYGTAYDNLSKLAMSSAVLTEAFKFLTTPPSLAFTAFATGTTGNNPTVTFTSGLAEVDN